MRCAPGGRAACGRPVLCGACLLFLVVWGGAIKLDFACQSTWAEMSVRLALARGLPLSVRLLEPCPLGSVSPAVLFPWLPGSAGEQRVLVCC